MASAVSHTNIEFSFHEDSGVDEENDQSQSVIYDFLDLRLLFQTALSASRDMLFSQRTLDTETATPDDAPSNMLDDTTQESDMDSSKTDCVQKGVDDTPADLEVMTTEGAEKESCHIPANSAETRVATPPEATPSDVTAPGTNVIIDEDKKTNTKSKSVRRGGHRKRCTRSERFHQRNELYFRQVDPEEFGFHLSCKPRVDVPQPEDYLLSNAGENMVESDASSSSSSPSISSSSSPSLENLESSKNLDSTAADVVPHQQDDLSAVSSTTPYMVDNDYINNNDDESYFADLGIDIHDSGSYYNEDDAFLDWDGVRFSTKAAAKSHHRHHNAIAQRSSRPPSFKEYNHNKQIASLGLLTTNERITLLELEGNSKRDVHLRKDKHRKVMKVHRAGKTHHFTLKNVIMNNNGRKKMFLSVRIVKKIGLDNLDFRHQERYCISPMPKHGVDLQVARAIQPKAIKPAKANAPPAQNLKHALHESNMPSGLEQDLAGFLLSIQNRDLTPEDYEMLLRLDEKVKAKTISRNVLASLKTETVGSDIANILMCVICMEPYQEGQVRKFLPCEHDFHSSCIDSWLANSSQNCPLDGLPITDS